MEYRYICSTNVRGLTVQWSFPCSELADWFLRSENGKKLQAVYIVGALIIHICKEEWIRESRNCS